MVKSSEQRPMTNAMKFLAGTVGAAAAITGLSIANPAPAYAGACFYENGRRVCVQRGYVAPRYYAPRYYGPRNVQLYRGPAGGGAVRVNGPNGTYVRWRR